MPTPTAYARTIQIAVATAAAEAGVPLIDVAARAGVDPAILADPTERVPHEVVMRAWGALAASDDDFGLRAARHVETMGRSLFEYAILNAADVRGTLQNFVRFQRLMHDASAHALEERATSAVFRLGLAPPLRLPAIIEEFIAASLVLRLRVLLRRPVEPREVRFSRPRPADPSFVDAVLRVPVTYGAPHVEVHWPREALDQPMVAADPALHAILVREIERALGLPAEPGAPAHRGADVEVLLKRALRVALGRGDSSLG